MRVLITGGAGFIGSNLAHRLLADGCDVTVFDTLSRQGVKRNLDWLAQWGNGRLVTYMGDIRDPDAVQEAVADQDAVFHLAGQVAVTTSVQQPELDLGVNLLGTFNVLEAIRALPAWRRPALIYTSSNKVYGHMETVSIAEEGQRYVYGNLPNGVPESQPLNFHSPYGCSKGAADQYVLDYARIYDLRTVVFRMSCIYGPRQFGSEDQGWIAHFLISSLLGRPLTIYGDGKQVRDALFIDDLVNAFLAALGQIDTVCGEVFNIGGGMSCTLSLLELLEWLQHNGHLSVSYTFDDWRPGDQRVYVSDIAKAHQYLGWQPAVSVPEGLQRLWLWLESQKDVFLELDQV